MPTNNADFTPTIDNSTISPSIGAYKATGSFRFWVQKVLPLVYDDSLSYYELLCKVVNYLNDVIENVDTLNDSVNSLNDSFGDLQNYVNATKDELISTYNELQSYVNNYFASLDIQDEINIKLDAMAGDGSLTNLIAPLVPDIVADWLSDNITPTTPVVDATLSISGAAADSKVTGDAIRNVNLNQKIKTNPIVIGSASIVGNSRALRSTGSVTEGGGGKFVRTDNATQSYGFYSNIKDGINDIRGHKIYIAIKGIDISGAVHFSAIRFNVTDETVTTNQQDFTNISNGIETIIDCQCDAKYLTVLLIPGAAPVAGEYFTVESLQWIDLTEMFGAGYEPTIDIFKQFYNVIYPFTISRATSDLAEVKTLIAENNIPSFMDRGLVTTEINLNDLNDFGLYILQAGQTHTNAPVGSETNAAWVINFKHSEYLKTQFFIRQTDGFIFWRRYVSGAWSTWYSYTYDIDDTLTVQGEPADAAAVGALSMLNRGQIETDMDFNDLKNPGYYLLFANHTHANAPSGFETVSGWVLVTSNASKLQVFQMYIHPISMSIFARKLSTSAGVETWGEWVRYYYDNTGDYVGLSGKKLSIVGDSISTYDGYIPSGYAYYYPNGDLNAVSKTWWRQVINKSGMSLLVNASWSGSWVCYDSSVSADSAKVAYTDARINALGDSANSPDIIIVFIGTNDFIHNGGSPLGTFDINSELPGEATPITDFKPAYATMINKIRTRYPAAHVYCCTLLERYRGSVDQSYPIKNGSGISLATYNRAIMDIAEWTGCRVIRLDTAFSLGQIPELTVDGTLHPNAAGAKIIANYILTVLANEEKKYI